MKRILATSMFVITIGLMGIGAMSTLALADSWWNPDEFGQTWGSGGSESWHTQGGIYGGHGWGPHPHYGPFWRGGDGGEFHPQVILGPGQSLHYSGPTQYAPHVKCHFFGHRGWGGGYTEQYDQC